LTNLEGVGDLSSHEGYSDVTVIIPTLNEEKNIADVIRELKLLGYPDILIIDANSQDKTIEVAKELGANVLLQGGNGKGNALRQAFNHDGLDSDVIVIMDADGSMSPKEIPRFLEVLESGADVVKGSRFMPLGYSEDMNFIRRIGNHFFLLLVNLFWSTRYTDLCYGFGAFRKKALEKLLPYLKATNFEIETEICIKAKKLGLKVEEVPSVEFQRKHGKSNLSIVKDGFEILRKIAVEIIHPR
jgi:glycosyltransferase involved in cell wall biosynthesis